MYEVWRRVKIVNIVKVSSVTKNKIGLCWSFSWTEDADLAQLCLAAFLSRFTPLTLRCCSTFPTRLLLCVQKVKELKVMMNRDLMAPRRRESVTCELPVSNVQENEDPSSELWALLESFGFLFWCWSVSTWGSMNTGVSFKVRVLRFNTFSSWSSQ